MGNGRYRIEVDEISFKLWQSAKAQCKYVTNKYFLQHVLALHGVHCMSIKSLNLASSTPRKKEFAKKAEKVEDDNFSVSPIKSYGERGCHSLQTVTCDEDCFAVKDGVTVGLGWDDLVTGCISWNTVTGKTDGNDGEICKEYGVTHKIGRNDGGVEDGIVDKEDGVSDDITDEKDCNSEDEDLNTSMAHLLSFTSSHAAINLSESELDLDSSDSETEEVYSSYTWGSEGIGNSCHHDALLECLFHQFSRSWNSMKSSNSSEMMDVILNSFKLRNIGQYHESKMNLWQYLEKINQHTFKIGNMLAVSNILERIWQDFTLKEREHLFPTIQHQQTCSIVSSHSTTSCSNSAILVVRSDELIAEHGVCDLSSTVRQLVNGTVKKKCHAVHEMEDSIDSVMDVMVVGCSGSCNGEVTSKSQIMNQPKFIFVEVENKNRMRISGFRQVWFEDGLSYKPAGIIYLHQHHFWSETLVSASGCQKGWYEHDGRKNHGMARFSGHQPRCKIPEAVHMIIFEKVQRRFQTYNVAAAIGSARLHTQSSHPGIAGFERCSKVKTNLTTGTPENGPLSPVGTPEKESLQEELQLLKDAKFICTEAQMRQLFQQIGCSVCNYTMHIETVKFIGMCAKLSLSCHNQHKKVWYSSPTYAGTLSTNALVSTSLLVAGGNVSKFLKFCQFLGLKSVSESAMYVNQAKFVSPTVMEEYEKMEDHIITDVIGPEKPVVLLADGRADSPGNCAKHVTVTFANEETGHMVKMLHGDRREADWKTPNLEPMKFKQGLKELIPKLTIREVVTDASHVIISMMKKDPEFQHIEHSLCVWHHAKNLSRNLSQLASKAANIELRAWIKDVRNHFWFCSMNSGGDVEVMKDLWLGLLHHVQDRHSWVGGECLHGPIDKPEGKHWLKTDSPAMETLRNFMTDRKLLGNFKYYTQGRVTSNLENFHNVLLQYAPKRIGFQYDAYATRLQLAYLDFNHHLNRPVSKDQFGTEKISRQISKRSGVFVPFYVKEKKKYDYIPDLIAKCLARRYQCRTRGSRLSLTAQGLKRKHGPYSRRLSGPELPGWYLHQQKKSRMARYLPERKSL